MIGCKKKVKFITGDEKEIDVRAGVETGVEYASAGFGFSNPHSGRKGKFVIVVRIKTPAITDPRIVADLKELNDEINRRS
jgi:DnaJ-class molecular chaperone